MPIIRVEMWKGATKEVKARLAKAFTEAMSQIANKPAEHISVLFNDYDTQDWAIGGELASDIDWGKKPSGEK